MLGFLINLPVINYFEHGSLLTATHGHGALMGVYGMLAIALLLFAMRNMVRPAAWNEKPIKIFFWDLNIGLMGMIVITLLPVGFIQLGEAFVSGFWSARSFAFYQTPLVHALLWLRFIPDTVFIILGVVPLVLTTMRGFLNLRPVAMAEDPATRPAPWPTAVPEYATVES